MTTYIAFEARPFVDACETERSILDVARKLATAAHRSLVPFVELANGILQERSGRSWASHWHWYPNGASGGRLVIWINLDRDESFADLHGIYERCGAHMLSLSDKGYKGNVIDSPDPEDDPEIHHRSWRFGVGELLFEIVCSFSASRICRVVEDGEETKPKLRIECVDGHLDAVEASELAEVF